jgi:hypothetical protein
MMPLSLMPPRPQKVSLLQSFLIVTVIIILALECTNDQKYMIVGFFSLRFLTWYPQFHLFSCKWHNFILIYGWIILIYMYTHMLYFVFPSINWFQKLTFVNGTAIKLILHYFPYAKFYF